MITILLTHYNQKDYICTAVNSVLEQTDPDWKLLICDDCSEESHYQSLLKRLEKISDRRIKLIRNDSNLGKIGTLKRLIKEADTELCGLLDDDDALTVDAIAVVKKAYADNPEVGFTYSDNYLCDAWLTPKSIKASEQINETKNFLQDFYFTALRTFRKSIYYSNVEIEEKYTYSDDNDMSYKLEEAGKGLYIPKPLYYYRLLPFSMSHDRRKWQRAKIGHFQSMLAALKRREGTNIPSLSRSELEKRLGVIRYAGSRLIPSFSQRPFEFIYRFIKYHYFTKEVAFVHAKKPKSLLTRFFKKLKRIFDKNIWTGPERYGMIVNRKKHWIVGVKSASHKFAFLNIQGNACTYLSHLVIKHNWDLPDGFGDLTEEVTQDLIGYEYDGEYKVLPVELSKLANTHTRFAVYRDPLDRFLSYYRKLAKGLEKYKNPVPQLLKGVEKKLKSRDWARLDLRLLPQSYFLEKAELDYIVPLAKLNKFLEEKFAIEPVLVKNQNPKPELSQECIEKIKSIYAQDYKILDRFKNKVF